MKRMSIGLVLVMSAVLAGAQATAFIREITGAVEVKAPGIAEWKAAAAGQELERGSVISTGFRSTALVMIGNSAVTVKPLTRLRVDEIASGERMEEVELNLRAGRVRADVVPPAGKAVTFTIRSAIATASVRGTVFEFDGIRLNVEEGRVHLGGETVAGAYIGAGHSTAVDTESGKTAAAADRVKEELSPAPPAGADAAPSGTGTTVPANPGLDMGFEWGE